MSALAGALPDRRRLARPGTTTMTANDPHGPGAGTGPGAAGHAPEDGPDPRVRELSDGARMPTVGLGLWKVPRESAADTVLEAIRLGYRHLDGACDYGNEAEVGEGIRRAVVEEGLCTRDELFVTSKLWNTYHDPEHVRPALERSLEDLGLDSLDLYLVHFPIALAYVPFDVRYPPEWVHDPQADPPRMELARVPLERTWHAVEALKGAGLVGSIGVCNYNTALLRDCLAYADDPPAVLQVESHPYLAQRRLLRMCSEEDVAVTAFSPLGSASYVEIGMAGEAESVLAEPEVLEIAHRVGRTPAQVVLRWAVERGTSVVAKSTRPERLAENLALFDFELSTEDVRRISALDRGRRFNDPGHFGEAAFNTFMPIYD